MKKISETLNLFMLMAGTVMTQKNKKPNILVIWGDDIGWSNITAYNHGMMGDQTANIDRVAKEGGQESDLTMATLKLNVYLN